NAPAFPRWSASLMSLRPEVREPRLLAALVIEIVRLEPVLERRLARRPFAVEHRKPGRVAVAALDDPVLAENSLERKPEAFRRAARRRVERVALPFVTAKAELIEHVSREQILRLGRARGALHRRRVHDVADLDDAIGRVDAHQRLIADRAPGPIVDHREVERISGAGLVLDISAKLVEAAIGPVGQISPHPVPGRVAVRALKERLGVRVRIEGRKRHQPALERDPLRPPAGMGVDQGADRLGRQRCRHPLSRIVSGGSDDNESPLVNDYRAARPWSAPGAGNGPRASAPCPRRTEPPSRAGSAAKASGSWDIGTRRAWRARRGAR